MSMMFRSTGPLLLLLSGALLSRSEPLVAEELKGVVEDPTGSAVPRAAVKLHHRASGQNFAKNCDDAGEFHFRELPAGQYDLRARATGFDETQVPVSVTATSSRLVHVRLEIAEATEQLTVNEKI